MQCERNESRAHRGVLAAGRDLFVEDGRRRGGWRSAQTCGNVMGKWLIHAVGSRAHRVSGCKTVVLQPRRVAAETEACARDAVDAVTVSASGQVECGKDGLTRARLSTQPDWRTVGSCEVCDQHVPGWRCARRPESRCRAGTAGGGCWVVRTTAVGRTALMPPTL